MRSLWEDMGRGLLSGQGNDIYKGSLLAQRGDGFRGAVGNKVRSEERRVGKECRSRWSPYH